MSLSDLTDAVRGKIGDSSGIGATLKFLCDGEPIFIDATVVPNQVSNDNRDADCTITVSAEDLAALVAGELDPTGAFMMGKLAVDGDMSVAMALANTL